MPLNSLIDKPARSRSKTRFLPVVVCAFDAELKFDDVEPKITGRELLELICRTLGLRETWYFGLQYVDSAGDSQWFRDCKKISDLDIPKASPKTFSLMVKFYPEDVSELIQEMTRHMFFLHVKQLILNADIYCPPEATVLLASYAVQAKYGDFDEKTYRPEMLATEDLLPQRVIDQYQMTPEMWAEKIKVWYAAIQGMPSDEAEMEYLKIAQDLEMYGLSYFPIRNKRNCDLWLGVSALGLFVYDQDNRLAPKVSFPWIEIKDISYNNKKFSIKMVDRKSPDFVFVVPKLNTNKIILDLCMGNHEMYVRRRRPDTIEIQQMKSQAREEKARKQMERDQLFREKQLREEAQREKEELQQSINELQEQFRLAQEAVTRSEEAADLLAEKVRVVEEESSLLARKAADFEAEKKRLQLAAIKTEEEKLIMERRACEAELIASRIVDECERRFQEAQQLKAELYVAKLKEKSAREKYQDFMRTSSLYGSVGSVASTPGFAAENDLASSDLLHGAVRSSAELIDCAPVDGDVISGLLTPFEVEKLSRFENDRLEREIEVERLQYIQQSQNLQEQLKTIKLEIDGLKIDDKHSHLDNLHEQSVQQGASKYPVTSRTRNGPSGPAKTRIQFYEDL